MNTKVERPAFRSTYFCKSTLIIYLFIQSNIYGTLMLSQKLKGNIFSFTATYSEGKKTLRF